ncbi:MAG TPA: lamin tail domain-containing protein [Thermoanaerobaculia bacterium]|nr:lamin tail domain-containing protein [Thermoanaerobaculia bacterium]
MPNLVSRLPASRRILAGMLLGLLALTAPVAANAADLFFSEYIEGSSNNKALEIYNGTGAAIDLGLAGYNVQMFFNGNPASTLTINLTGVVADGDVFVLAQSASNATILAVADQTNGSGWFNGDDAIVLRKGTTFIDSIGQTGFDPGTEWGTGLVSTADNTLRRNTDFCAGDPIANDVFDPAAQWDGFAQDTFGGLGSHSCIAVPPPPPPPVLEKEIWEIQGAGLASPFVNQTVKTLDNVVTAIASNGFFIQTPEARGDADAETSNGVFVFTGSAPAVQVGDQVDVQGNVVEFFNLTEIGGTVTFTIDASGLPLPSAILLDENTPSPDQPQPANELERFEGMIVRVENAFATSATDQFGDTAIVAGTSRAFREPGILFPGLPGLPVWDGNPEVFEIDPDAVGLPPLSLPAGATIHVAEGPLSFAFSDYQIWPTTLSADGTIALGPVRARDDGEFTVASQNLLRLMDTINDACSDDVPTPAVYANRLNKVSLLIRDGLGAPDIVVVQEVEKLSVLQDVAAKILADDPSIVYTAYLQEGNDVGCIDIGFLVRDTVQVDSVTQFGAADTFTFNNETALLHDRPPLVLTGSYTGNGAPFPITVIGIHNRSLSGIDGNDGARIRAKRHEQALRISQYIQSLQTADPDIRLVVTGDFNAFQFTDGYVDAMGQLTGNPDPAGALIPATDEIDPDLTNQLLSEPEEERYSFVFDGSAQALDHSLTSQALNPFVRGLDHVRGNADSPASFGSDPNTALRAADHDGLALYLMSDFDADGVADDVDNCPNTAIPEAAPTKKLNPNHYALVNGDLIFDTVGNGPTFTIQQTGGCSCEQIVAAQGLGNGHLKHGCNQDVMQDWIAGLGQ